MPRVKIDYVVSFSSEDPDHPSANLLQESATGQRWLAAAGAGTASVVLQLARAVKISSLSLGAHRAALVEVLVGRSETPQYEVLVPRCVLQTPADARRGANPDRVRSFSAEEMSDGTRDRRWDRVRVVCSQPYDKLCKFGLSFVHVFEPEEAHPVPGARPQPPAICTPLRRESSDDEAFRPGALFAAHLLSSGGAEMQTSGKQITQATSRAFRHIPDPSSHLVKTPLSSDKARHRDSERDQPNTSRNDQKCHRTKEKEKYKETKADSRNERNSNFDNASASRTKDANKNKQVTVSKNETKSRCDEEISASKKKKKRDGEEKTDKQRSPRREHKESRKRSHEDRSRLDEDHDTDDEIEKFLKKHKREEDHGGGRPNHAETPSKEDHGHKTMETEQSRASRVLPAFLDGLTFAIDPGVTKIGFDDQLLRRYVLAYGGELAEEAESANYLLCGARPPRPAAAPLRSDWIWRCHRRGRRVRIQNYLLA